ncbi:MAG: hypothetical protein M0Z52_09650 [Actinomycetota bacterium]|nr:hypothetical protein [Actinomycetota bacterium]
MKIECYISERCGSEAALKENIEKALVLEGGHADVDVYRLRDGQAAEKGLRGSPSVFVDGEEVQPADIEGFS